MLTGIGAFLHGGTKAAKLKPVAAVKTLLQQKAVFTVYKPFSITVSSSTEMQEPGSRNTQYTVRRIRRSFVS